jgi:hypothetical protein
VVGHIHVADLETRDDELISLLQFAFRRIVQLVDVIGDVASSPTERVIDVEKDFVIRTDVELLEDICSLLLGRVAGRPVGSPQKIAIGARRFRAPVGTRNPRERPLTVQ